MFMVQKLMTLMQIHVPLGRLSVDDVPGAPQVRLKVTLPTLGIHVNYQCPTHSKCSPATTVLARIVMTQPRDSLRMSSPTSHPYSLSLPTGVSQFVLHQFFPVQTPPRDSLPLRPSSRSLPTGVPLFVPAVLRQVPAVLPILALVMNAAKN